MYGLESRVESLLGQKPAGSSVNGMYFCPFHPNTESPALSIHLSEGVFHCFGCGESGDLPKLYRLMGQKIDSGYMLSALVKSVFNEPNREHDFSVSARQFVHDLNSSRGEKCMTHFLSSRPISRDALKHFGIGYSFEKNAISFPYWDNSRVTGIKYRAWGGGKFSTLHSSYGIYNVNAVRGRPTVILCEGESDSLSAYTHLNGKIAVGGTSGAIFDEDARRWKTLSTNLIFAKRLYLAFDPDEAGDRAAEQASEVLGESRCVRIRPSGYKDLSDFLADGGTLDQIGMED